MEKPRAYVIRLHNRRIYICRCDDDGYYIKFANFDSTENGARKRDNVRRTEIAISAEAMRSVMEAYVRLTTDKFPL